MSMRVPGSEENSVEPSAVKVAEGSPSHSSSANAITTTTTSTKYEISPLLRIFTSKEIVPRIFEYEKALLVMKEHDYARGLERREVLKLSSLLNEPQLIFEEQQEVPVPPPGTFSDLTMLLNIRKDILQFRESLSRREDTLVSDHLREVIGMQIDLIREQQEQIHDKDKELCTVRKDKEQMEARLERMERRLAILKKHSRSKYDNNSDTESPQAQGAAHGSSIDPVGYGSTTPKIKSHRESLINLERYPRSRSNSNDHGSRVSRSSRISSHSSTPVPQDAQDTTPVSGGTGKRNQKRKLSDNIRAENNLKKKRSKQNEILTRLEYTGLGLPLSPHLTKDWSLDDKSYLSHNDDSGITTNNNSVDLAGSVLSSSSASSFTTENGRGVINGSDSASLILVPSWKTCVVKTNSATVTGDECEEDMSDDSFVKRHRKPEEDEKRRKRWDVQRTRALRNHEELLRKYNQKGTGGDRPEKKKERVVTFLPKLSEVEAIEVKDIITVSAFGMPLPLIKPREFELSWFDLDKREATESIRTTRSMAKATTTRTSAGSSAEEDMK